MGTDHKLDLLALVAVACLFVGDGFGWTWYLRVAAWAVLLTFFAIVAQRWLRRRREKKPDEQHH